MLGSAVHVGWFPELLTREMQLYIFHTDVLLAASVMFSISSDDTSVVVSSKYACEPCLMEEVVVYVMLLSR